MFPLSRIPSLQPKIEAQLKEFIGSFPASLRPEVDRILLIGSCSRGEATYRSDIDLLVVLREGPLTYSRVSVLRRILEEECLERLKPRVLDFQVHFVLPSVERTQEPAMRQALSEAKVLLDSGKAA